MAWSDCHVRAGVVIEPVSANSLCKTGVFRETAGDFPLFLPAGCETGTLETKPNARKALISGPVRRRLQTVANRGTAWLGREGSNLRMAESKSAALPLGYAPSGPLGTAATRASADSLEWCRSIGSGAAFQPPGGAKYHRRRWRRAMPHMSATPARSRQAFRHPSRQLRPPPFHGNTTPRPVSPGVSHDLPRADL